MVDREEQRRIDEANKTGLFTPKPEDVAKAAEAKARQDANKAMPPGSGPQPDTPTATYHDPIPPPGAPGTSGTPVKPEEAAAVAAETNTRRRNP